MISCFYWSILCKNRNISKQILKRVLVEQIQLPTRVSVDHCDEWTSTSNLKSVTFAEQDQCTTLYTSLQECTSLSPLPPPPPPPNNPYYYETPIEKELADSRNQDVELAACQLLAESSKNNVQLAGDTNNEEEEKLLNTKLAVKEEPETDRFLAVEATLATLIEQQSKLISRFNKLSK